MENNNLPTSPTYQYQPRPTPIKKERRFLNFDRKDGVFAIIFIAISIFLANSLIVGGFNAGFSLFIGLALIGLTVYLASKTEKPSPYAYFLMGSGLIIISSFWLFNDPFTKFCGVVLTMILTALGFAELTGNKSGDDNTVAIMFEVIKTYFKLPFTRTALTVRSAIKSSTSEKRKGFLWGLIGVAAAFPALIIIVPLLMSSDAAFESLINKTILADSAVVIGSLILGSVLFIYFFPSVFSYRKKDTVVDKPKKENCGVIPLAVTTAFLGAIGIFYVVYLFSQLAYFFGGLKGLLPDDYSLSDYARRGFFEMGAICFINLVIIALASLLTKKKEDGGMSAVLKAVLTFFGVFSLIIVGSAFSKMFLYMARLGLTQKRIITSVFMLIVTIVLIAVILRLYIKKFPYFKVITVCVAIIGITVSFVDVDRIVAKYNTTAYLNGNIEYLDGDYIYTLSNSSVPYTLELVKNCKDAQVKETARADLQARFNELYTFDYEKYEWVLIDDNDIRGYNYSERKAAELLRDNLYYFQDGSYYFNYPLY